MAQWPGCPRQARVGAVLLITLLIRAQESSAEEDEWTPDVQVARATYLPAIVVKALQEASLRLSDPACREIFSDFRDLAGRTLQQNLDSLGVSGERYLTWILFYEGRGKLMCERPNVVAATVPGSRSVFLCTAQFSGIALRRPGLAAALLIHEELHSLGLGENPPRSGDITAQVLRRCGQ